MSFRRGSVRLDSAIAVLVIFAVLPACDIRDSASQGELAPEAFAHLPPERAAQALQTALTRGVLKYRSTAEVAAWLQARPNAWQSEYRSNPLRAYNSYLRSLSPESQAWLLVAVYWVVPELANPPVPGADSSPTSEREREMERTGTRVSLPFPRLDFRAGPIRGAAGDFPAAAAVIAERLRSGLASGERRSAAEAFSLQDPLAEFRLLVAVRRGDPALTVDATRVRSALESLGTWSPMAQISVGLDLWVAAKDARDASARAALVGPATDAIIEGRARYYRAHPRLVSSDGPVGNLYSSYTREDEPIIRDIETRFFARASQEACPNFGENVLLVSRKALTALWLDRFARGADALCLWYPPHWVPTNEIVTKHPEIALKLVARPDRPWDGLRREILIKSLAPYLFADGDWSGSSDGQPIGVDANPALGRAVRDEVKPPAFRLDLGADGIAIIHFLDPDFERAWQARPAARRTGTPGAAADVAGLAALLGVPEKDLRSLIEKEFIPHGCRFDSLPAKVWGGPQDRWRLASLSCAGGRSDRVGSLPLESAAWPRNTSDADAFSWLVWSYEPMVLADAKGARVVWLPDRVRGNSALASPRIVGVADLNGEIVMVAQTFEGPCGRAACGRADLRIEICELTQNVFSFLRSRRPRDQRP